MVFIIQNKSKNVKNLLPKKAIFSNIIFISHIFTHSRWFICGLITRNEKKIAGKIYLSLEIELIKRMKVRNMQKELRAMSIDKWGPDCDLRDGTGGLLPTRGCLSYKQTYTNKI